MQNQGDQGGWDEWRNHILLELKRMNHNIESYDDKVTDLDKRVTTLQTKAVMVATFFSITVSAIGALVTNFDILNFKK